MPTNRNLSRESGFRSPENAELRDSILRQLKEMLNGLQGKGFSQLNDRDANEKGNGAATYPALASPSTTLPASFYLSGKPSWWNITAPWPAVEPDISGGNISGVGGFAYHNPAAYCYLFVMGGQVNGSPIMEALSSLRN